MNTQNYYVLGGLAVGALLGYHYAPGIAARRYQPYDWIHSLVNPLNYSQHAAVSDGNALGAAAIAPLATYISAGNTAWSELQKLFGSSPSSDDSNYTAGNVSNDGGE